MNTQLFLILAGIVFCLMLSSFFSSSEMAYSSCNTMRLENLMEDSSKKTARKASLAFRITEKFDDALGAILIGNNLVNIASSSLTSVLILLLTGSSRNTWAGTLLITVFVIIFGETIPKIVSKKNANRLALSYAYIITGLMIILKPLVKLVVFLVNLICSLLPGKGEEEEEPVRELQSLIDTAEDEDVLDSKESELVHAALDFPTTSAAAVMTARVDVEAIDIEDDWEKILLSIESSHHSRMPVYEGTIDNVIGILYLNHFLKAMTEDRKVDIRSLLMKPCFVYKTTKLPDVLDLLRKEKQHLAVVSDEYGGTLGVVSMEDVLEQIVGEIWDETDSFEPEIIKRSEQEYELDGDMSITDFLELFHIREDDFPCESKTVGGWTVERFGTFPHEKDSFAFQGLKVTVLVMDPDGRRVEKVLVERPPETNGKEK